MSKNTSGETRITVYFEAPFWVGVYEREWDGRLQVCKITFGAEPKDYEVYSCLLQHWHTLVFSPSAEGSAFSQTIANPKRRQREIKKQLAAQGAGTKAQQALQMQREAGKAARQKQTREQKQQRKEQQYALRQQKKKKKQKGH